ncbi:hypothetical protein ACFFRR_008901 [Megaselia abdita]
MQMMKMPHQSSSTVRCRTCFKETKQLADILKSPSIKDLIETHLHISVEQSDVSRFICESCVQSLYQFQAFYQTCHMVQKQICEFEDLMSQFRTSSTESMIVDRMSESLTSPLPNSVVSNSISNTSLTQPRIRNHENGHDHRISLMNEVEDQSYNNLSQEHRRRTCLLNDLPNTGRITSRRKSVGPYERRGIEISRSKSMAPIKVQPKVKRIIAFKLKNERPHNILSLILMDRTTKEVLNFDELSFDELNDVKRCVNDPKIFAKIQDHLKKATVSEDTRNILRSLVRREIC